MRLLSLRLRCSALFHPSTDPIGSSWVKKKAPAHGRPGLSSSPSGFVPGRSEGVFFSSSFLKKTCIIDIEMIIKRRRLRLTASMKRGIEKCEGPGFSFKRHKRSPAALQICQRSSIKTCHPSVVAGYLQYGENSRPFLTFFRLNYSEITQHLRLETGFGLDKRILRN